MLPLKPDLFLLQESSILSVFSQERFLNWRLNSIMKRRRKGKKLWRRLLQPWLWGRMSGKSKFLPLTAFLILLGLPWVCWAHSSIITCHSINLQHTLKWVFLKEDPWDFIMMAKRCRITEWFRLEENSKYHLIWTPAWAFTIWCADSVLLSLFEITRETCLSWMLFLASLTTGICCKVAVVLDLWQ